MVWGKSIHRQDELENQFRGGKYVPVDLRPMSVPLMERGQIDSPDRRTTSALARLTSLTSSDRSRENEGEEEAERALQAVQVAMAESPGLREDDPPHSLSVVEQRRVVIQVRQAANLPIMDDEVRPT